MTAAVRDHGISQTVFLIQPAKQQAQAAIQQKASENEQGRVAKHNKGWRQMSGGKQKRGYDVRRHENRSAWGFALVSKEFVQQKFLSTLTFAFLPSAATSI